MSFKIPTGITEKRSRDQKVEFSCLKERKKERETDRQTDSRLVLPLLKAILKYLIKNFECNVFYKKQFLQFFSLLSRNVTGKKWCVMQRNRSSVRFFWCPAEFQRYQLLPNVCIPLKTIDCNLFPHS